MAKAFSHTLVVHDDPKAISSEAFRTLRTNLKYISPDAGLRTILFTSAGQGEGKSTVSANLAASMAQTGNRVILVDCDLRKPVVHRFFNAHNSVGLTSILTGQVQLTEAIRKTKCEGLDIITSGPIPPNPAELLQSKAMQTILEQLQAHYDMIVLDAPPVLPVADALILTPYTDGVVFVVAAQEVPKDIALRAKQLIENTNTKILGVVLNRVNLAREGEQYYYNYYSSESKD